MASPEDVCHPFWYVESEAKHQVSSDMKAPQQLTEYKCKGKLIMGNGQGMKVTKIGKAYVPSSNNRALLLKNALIVPSNCQKPI